jgi:hypothetical protein
VRAVGAGAAYGGTDMTRSVVVGGLKAAGVFGLSALVLVIVGGCTVDVPQLSDAGLGQFINQLERQLATQQQEFENAIQDPLDTDPYPVLVGGDSAHVYYATGLTDIRLNLPGRQNDLVIPSFVGPSNLYLYQDGKRMPLALDAAKLNEEIAALSPARRSLSTTPWPGPSPAHWSWTSCATGPLSGPAHG